MSLRDELGAGVFTDLMRVPTPDTVRTPVGNVFCKTGQGGGVDPTCGTGKSAEAVTRSTQYVELPKGKKPTSAKDLAHTAQDWVISGNWEKAGTAGAALVQDTGKSGAVIAKATMESLPKSWVDYAKSSLQTIKTESPPPPLGWATMAYFPGQKTIYADIGNGIGEKHSPPLVHEVAHALDAASGYRLSSLPGIKGVKPTGYVQEYVKSGGKHPDHEGFAEVAAMYSYPKGRQYLKDKHPEAHAVMEKLYNQGPQSLLGGSPSVSPATSQPPPHKVLGSNPSSAVKHASSPTRPSHSGTAAGTTSGTKVSVLSLSDVNTATGTGRFTDASGNVKQVKRAKDGKWYVV